MTDGREHMDRAYAGRTSVLFFLEEIFRIYSI